MSHRLFLLGLALCGAIFTLLVLAVVAEMWVAYPPEHVAAVKDAFWQAHTTVGQWYDVVLVWGLYFFTLLMQVWPLFFVVLCGVLLTRLVLVRYGNEELSAYMERIHALETTLDATDKAGAMQTERWERLQVAMDAVFEPSGELWLVVAKDGRIRRWNSAAMAFAARFHPNLESLEGRNIAELWRSFAVSPLAALFANPKPQPWHGEVEMEQDGVFMLCWAWPMGDDFALLARDVTGRHTGAETLQSSEAMLRSMVEQSLRPIAIVDKNWRYLYVAQSWPVFFHLDTQVSLLGKMHPQVIPNFPPQLPQVTRQLESGQRVEGEEEKLTIAGREEIVKWAVRPWRDAENSLGGYIITLTPVTELVRLRQQLKQGLERENTLAYSDSLTGLPNRQLFHDRLNMAIATAFRQLSKVGLIFIDLDGFKKVNDTLGHDYGDLLLKQVAMRLKAMLRDTDTVARLGGDEFVIILNVRDRADAEMVAQKVLKVLQTPFDLNGKPANIGGSLGIAMYPLDANSSADLIKKADAAMYEAKHSGKNTYRFAKAG